ncbi:hypothetical protein Q9966_013796 [Columba livia]|nr:hypothetical protein Q9966_013796 [Columba livia]
MELVCPVLRTEMPELPGMTSSQEVLVNTTGAHRQVHLEEVGKSQEWFCCEQLCWMSSFSCGHSQAAKQSAIPMPQVFNELSPLPHCPSYPMAMTLCLNHVGSQVHTGKMDQYEWYSIQRPLIWHKWGLLGYLFCSNPDLLPYAPADAAVVLVLL